MLLLLESSSIKTKYSLIIFLFLLIFRHRNIFSISQYGSSMSGASSRETGWSSCTSAAFQSLNKETWNTGWIFHVSGKANLYACSPMVSNTRKGPTNLSEVCSGCLSFSNFGWRAAQGRLPCIPHPCVFCHSISAADVLTCPDFVWPVSSLMQPVVRRTPHFLF